MKIINVLCLVLIILSAGCTGKGGAGDEEAISKCNHYRACYQNDIKHTSVCIQWNTKWLKEGMKQLSRAYLVQKCYLDKDKIRDECFGTDSEAERLLKIEECSQIGIDPKKPNNN